MMWMPNYNADTYIDDQRKWISNFVKLLLPIDHNKPFQIFDIGAHNGLIIDSILSSVDGRNYIIHAFEPNPNCYYRLCSKYQYNSRIKIHCDVVSDKSNELLDFNFSNQNSSLSYLYQSPVPDKIALYSDWQTIKRSCVTIDDFVDRNIETAFIKIDAEGHDFLIIKGCEWILKNHRPFLLFEFSGKMNGINYKFLPKAWYEFFRQNNYTLVAPMGPRDLRFILSHYNTNQPDLADILAIPEEKKYITE